VLFVGPQREEPLVFLRNAWYVAARSSDVGQSLAPLRMLGENIVVFRTENGDPAALEDACCHRKLPLSMGRLHGDHVVCGYHGLTFDRAGKCVASPTQSRLPAGARVRSYPAIDRWGLLWVWMGNPALADADKIVSIDNHDVSGWALSGTDAMTCACNYLWLVDNLLDPSHVAWVHATTFAAGGTEDTPLNIDASNQGVVVSRWILDQEPPPYYAALVKFAGRCDRLQHYEVCYPSIGINKSIFAPAGSGGVGKPLHPDAYVMVSYHFLTPIDMDSTRYFWLQHRNTDPHDAAVTARIAANARNAFEEDRRVLEAVHRGMATAATPHINLALDAGSLRFRRDLTALIERDQAPS
jgi:phenylpropionate dioxygenase-like ring-hydroxylating dioxygenase large terminal subunit